jgi:hypothetical protein
MGPHQRHFRIIRVVVTGQSALDEQSVLESCHGQDHLVVKGIEALPVFTFLSPLLHDLTTPGLHVADQFRSYETRDQPLKLRIVANPFGAILIPFDTTAKPFR